MQQGKLSYNRQRPLALARCDEMPFNKLGDGKCAGSLGETRSLLSIYSSITCV